MGKKKQRRGAPQKLPEERRSAMLPIRLTEAEKAEIDTAAEGKASAWARDVLLRAAKRRNRK